MVSRPPVDVVIPEQLAASYGLYIWPCAPVLAWYIWLHQVRFTKSEVLNQVLNNKSKTKFIVKYLQHNRFKIKSISSLQPWQDQICGKEVLELGAGTALPGLLCAKVGAKKVYLSDEAEQGNTIKNISEAVSLNSLQEKVEKALLWLNMYGEKNQILIVIN